MAVPLPAFWGVAEDDCNEVGIAQGLNRGGCFVEALVYELSAETICLRVLLPTGRWLKLSARPVYYASGRGIGASFTGVSDEDAAMIDILAESFGGDE